MMQPDQTKPPTTGADEAKLPAKPEYEQVRLRFARKSNQLYTSLANFNQLAGLPSDVMRLGELITDSCHGRITEAYCERLAAAGWNAICQEKGNAKFLLIRSKDLHSVMGISMGTGDAVQNRTNNEFTIVYRVPKDLSKGLADLVQAVQVWLSISPAGDAKQK